MARPGDVQDLQVLADAPGCVEGDVRDQRRRGVAGHPARRSHHQHRAAERAEQEVLLGLAEDVAGVELVGLGAGRGPKVAGLADQVAGELGAPLGRVLELQLGVAPVGGVLVDRGEALVEPGDRGREQRAHELLGNRERRPDAAVDQHQTREAVGRGARGEGARRTRRTSGRRGAGARARGRRPGRARPRRAGSARTGRPGSSGHGRAGPCATIRCGPRASASDRKPSRLAEIPCTHRTGEPVPGHSP